MSAEADLRALLVAYAPLVAAVPVGCISIDSVDQGLARPYIAFSKQSAPPSFGLDNTLLGTITTIDIQCIGTSRLNAIAVRELVEAALLASGQGWVGATAAYDPENDLEVEVSTVDWVTG